MTLYTFLKLFTLVVFFLNMEGYSNYLVISGQYWIRSSLNLLSFKMVSLHCFNLSLYEPCSPHTCGTALHCTASNTSMYFSRHGLYACPAYKHKKILAQHERWWDAYPMELWIPPLLTLYFIFYCEPITFARPQIHYIITWKYNNTTVLALIRGGEGYMSDVHLILLPPPHKHYYYIGLCSISLV